MDQFSHSAIDELMRREENRSCFDCGASQPKWASLNNAVFVCLKCAGIHRSFGVNVSFIRSLTIDAWEEKQIEWLRLGGNLRLKTHLEEFHVPSNASMDFKYMIRAVEYYRQLLKSEVEHLDPPFKPDIISGLEMLDYGLERPFDNRQFISNQSEPTVKKGYFSDFMSKAKSGVNYMSGKIKDMDLAEKLSKTKEQSLVIAKATSTFVVKKGKEVYNSEFVQNIAYKTEAGINVIVDKTKKMLNKNEEDRLDLPVEMNVRETLDRTNVLP